MAKDTIIKLGMDASEIESKLDGLVKKIQLINDKFKSSSKTPPPSPGASAASVATQRNYLKGSLEDEQKSRNAKMALDSFNRSLADQEKQLDAILRKKKAITQQDVIEVKNLKENINTISAARNRLQRDVFNKDIFGGANGANGVGGMAGLIKSMGIAAAAKGLDQIGREYSRRPIDVTRMQGTAAAGTVGTILSQMQSGQFAYEGMYGNERKKASEKASSAEGRGRVLDKAEMAAGIALMIGGAAATATGFGAVPGGVAFASGAATVFGKRSMFDKEKYEAQKSAQYAEDFNSTLQSEKDLVPFKQDAIEKLKKSGSQYLGMQRALNMNDPELFKYLGRITGAGFTDEMGTNASRGILGAGGSTAMAGQSQIALQAERGLGLSNSQQVLGMLSGTQQIPATSTKTLEDIFARGLDSSKYAEENRKFIENVAQQVSAGGTTSEGAADKIAEIMKDFLGGATSQRGIAAGKEAFQAYSKTVSSTSGYSGAINIASALSDPVLRKIKDPAELQRLISLNPNEIDEDKEIIINSASRLGVTPKQLADILSKRQNTIGSTILNRSKDFSSLQKERKKWLNMPEGIRSPTFQPSKGVNLTALEEMYGKNYNIADEVAQKEGVYGLVDESLGKTPEMKAKLDALKKQAKSNLENKDTKRGGDTVVQSAAVNAQTSLETLSQSINDFATHAINAANTMNIAIGKARVSNDAVMKSESDIAAWKSQDHSHSKDPLGELIRLTNRASQLRDSASAANKATTK